MEEKKRRGRNPIEGKRVPKKKKDVNGNKLKGRPSFDHMTPVVDDSSKLDRCFEELKHGEITAKFYRDKLPELFQEIEEPLEALKAYSKHLILTLTPKETLNVYCYRVCPHRTINDLLYQQNLTEMTFDFRSQDKNHLEGYFKNILETGMHMAISKGDLKSFFAGAKLMKDLFGIETRKVIRAEVGGKSPADIFGKEFINICRSSIEEEDQDETKTVEFEEEQDNE